jgi:hypothetical protein
MLTALLEQQALFRAQGKDWRVSLAYHYTTQNSLASIRDNGLKSKSERDASGQKAARENGAAFGDGVYVALDHNSSSQFGETCLVVGCLYGSIQPFGRGGAGLGGFGGGFGGSALSAHLTALLAQRTGGPTPAAAAAAAAAELHACDITQAPNKNWRVLKKSSQVVPLYQIPKQNILNNANSGLRTKILAEINELINSMLNIQQE